MSSDQQALSPGGFKPQRCAATGRRLCRWCGQSFEHHDDRQWFCTSGHKKKWLTYWRSKGPSLARGLFDYRIARKKGALSDLCNIFADYLDDFRRKDKGRKTDDSVS
jgi:hypothetical protein